MGPCEEGIGFGWEEPEGGMTGLGGGGVSCE